MGNGRTRLAWTWWGRTTIFLAWVVTLFWSCDWSHNYASRGCESSRAMFFNIQHRARSHWRDCSRAQPHVATPRPHPLPATYCYLLNTGSSVSACATRTTGTRHLPCICHKGRAPRFCTTPCAKCMQRTRVLACVGSAALNVDGVCLPQRPGVILS